MRFTIMQTAIGYGADGAAAETVVSGQEGTALRALILHQGNPLSTEEIARHLTRSGRRTVSSASVPGYIKRLRNDIGQERVQRTVGYCAAIDPADVDAFVFERLIGTCDVVSINDVDSVTPGDIDKYEQLLELHAMWKKNPALPFADDQDDDFLSSRYHDFERYWDCLQRSIIYTELRSRRKPRIEKAISRIDQLLTQDPADEQLWALLFRARASLPGGESAGLAVLDRINAQFPQSLPGELRYTVNRVTTGHTDALFEVDRTPRSQEDQQRVTALVQTLGISPASELELRRSKLEPLECIGQTVSQLRFQGILATKWVADSYVRSRFTRLLERLDGSGGGVQFLLLDPGSESYQRFSAQRWSSSPLQPLDLLRDLSTAHPSFTVRLYDALPTFRIVLIDQSIVSFSPYLIAPRTDRAQTGWEAPHIILDRTAPWPLARTFETLFGETWRTAAPLET